MQTEKKKTMNLTEEEKERIADMARGMAVILKIADLLGVDDPDGLHKHKCKKCGYIWQHENSCGGPDTDKRAVKAHTCVKCGEEQWWKYDGKEKAETHSCMAQPIV